MKILVAGGAGFIGSHLADQLIEKGNKVIIIDNLSAGLKENINITASFYHEDISNYEKIKEIFEKEKPDIIYHFAAQINVRKSLENPVEDAKQNILNTLNLLELAVKYNIKHFIFSSTGGAIYGDAEIPTKENAEAKPISPYGCSKLAVEKYLDYYREVYGLKYTILRYANVYGPRQNPEGEAGVIAIFLNKMFNKENPIIFGGSQTRDFVYVEDIVKANIMALNEKESNIYNVSTGKETDITSLFNKINRLFSNKFQAEYKENKKGEQMKSCLSFDKIHKSLGWLPENSLELGLGKTYTWLKKKLILPSTMSKLDN